MWTELSLRVYQPSFVVSQISVLAQYSQILAIDRFHVVGIGRRENITQIPQADFHTSGGHKVVVWRDSHTCNPSRVVNITLNFLVRRSVPK